MTLSSKPSSAALIQPLASMIASIGNESFFEALLCYIGQVAQVDSALVVACDGVDIPAICCDQLLPAQRTRFYETWLNGVFELGPFFTAHRQKREDGFYTLSEISPDNFQSSQYFRVYYRQIKQSDMVGYLVQVGPEQRIIIHLGRVSGNPRFSPANRDRLRAQTPVIVQAVAKHWQTRGIPERRPAAAMRHDLLRGFGRGTLSDREYEIVHQLLRGHSTKAIAHGLAISDHTVRAHLKHAYQKLKVRSQGELFSLLLHRLDV